MMPTGQDLPHRVDAAKDHSRSIDFVVGNEHAAHAQPAGA